MVTRPQEPPQGEIECFGHIGSKDDAQWIWSIEETGDGFARLVDDSRSLDSQAMT
jgi:hypothetical protein